MKKSLLLSILTFIISFNSFGQDITEVKVGTNYYCNMRGNTIFFDIDPSFLSVMGINFKISNEKGNMYSYYISVPGFASPNAGVDYSKVSSVAIMEIHDDFDLGIYEETYIKSYNLLFLTTPGVALGVENREPNELYFPSINLVTTLNGNNFNNLFQFFKQGNDYYIQIANSFDTQNLVLDFNFNSDYILSISGNNLIKNTTLSGVSKTTTLPLNITQLNSLTVTYTNFEQKVFKVYVNVFTPLKSSYKNINYISIYNNFNQTVSTGKIVENIIYFNANSLLGINNLIIDIKIIDHSLNGLSRNKISIQGYNTYKDQYSDFYINNFSITSQSFLLQVTAEDESTRNYTVQINFAEPNPKIIPILNQIFVYKTGPDYYSNDLLEGSLINNDTIYTVFKSYIKLVPYSGYELLTKPFLKSDLKNVYIKMFSNIDNAVYSIDGATINNTPLDLSYNRKLTIYANGNIKNYIIKSSIKVNEYDYDPIPFKIMIKSTKYKDYFWGSILGNNINIQIPNDLSLGNLKCYIYAPYATLLNFDGNIKLSNKYETKSHNLRVFNKNFSTTQILEIYDINGKQKKFNVNVSNNLNPKPFEYILDSSYCLKSFVFYDYSLFTVSNSFPIIFSTPNLGTVTLPYQLNNSFRGYFQHNYNIVSIAGILSNSDNFFFQNITTLGIYNIREITSNGNSRNYTITLKKNIVASDFKGVDFLTNFDIISKTLTGNTFSLMLKSNQDMSFVKANLNFYKLGNEKKSNYDLPINVSINGVNVLNKSNIYINDNIVYMDLSKPAILKIQAQDFSLNTFTVIGYNLFKNKLSINSIKTVFLGYYNTLFAPNFESLDFTTIVGNNIFMIVPKISFPDKMLPFNAIFESNATGYINSNQVFSQYNINSVPFYDFSSPVLMDVYAENGDKRTYTIYVNFVDELPPLPNKIEETEMETPIEITVYPNPNSGEIIMIKTNLEVAKTITIFDVMGNTKHTLQSSEKSVSIQDISLSKGIYFVKIATENTVVTKKIVVE